jgi:hypothetical protein
VFVAHRHRETHLRRLFGDVGGVSVGTLGLEKTVERQGDVQRIGDDEADIKKAKISISSPASMP